MKKSAVHLLREAVMKSSRGQKLTHFFSLCPEGSRVLDVGVSGQVKEKPGQAVNYFLMNYTRDPSTYTGLGIDDMTGLREKHPDFRFVQYDGRVFPFEDKAFDWVFSNAVIEHVGDESAQLFFIDEMLRVAKRVYFTTPNKYFPIETHTNQFFIHWHRERFSRWLAKHRPTLASNLRLLSMRDLNVLMRASGAAQYEIFRNRFFGWPMTLSVVARS